LIVVDRVHDRHHQDHVDARGVKIFNRAQLHVEEISDLAVAVRLVRHAVELQVRHAQSCLFRGECELAVLREADAVGRALHGEVTDLARVLDRLQEVRAERGLAAAELHAHLTTRLDRQRVVEDLLHLVPLELVDVAHLIGVHEARIAHHVASIGEIDGEHGAASVLDAAGAVFSQMRLRAQEVATRIKLLDALEELRIDRHDVLEVAVLRAVFDHQDFSVALDDLRFDLARLSVDEIVEIATTAEDLVAHLFHASRTEAVGLARPTERRQRALFLSDQRRGRPLRLDRLAGDQRVELLHHRPRHLGGAMERRLDRRREGATLFGRVDDFTRNVGRKVHCDIAGTALRPAGNRLVAVGHGCAFSAFGGLTRKVENARFRAFCVRWLQGGEFRPIFVR
jgi:hypothetical protein